MTNCDLCGHEIKWHYHDSNSIGLMNSQCVYPCEATVLGDEQCMCIAIQTSLSFAIAKGYDSYPYCQICACAGKATNDWTAVNWIATCNVCGATVDLHPSRLQVDHPSHYGGDTTYEAIKVIEAWGLNFNLGNVVKYVRRLTEKGDPIENLEKLIWYANRELELRKASQGQATEH